MKRKKLFLITMLLLALAAAGTVRADESTAEAVTVPEAEHPGEAAEDADRTSAEQQGGEDAADALEECLDLGLPLGLGVLGRLGLGVLGGGISLGRFSRSSGLGLAEILLGIGKNNERVYVK